MDTSLIVSSGLVVGFVAVLLWRHWPKSSPPSAEQSSPTIEDLQRIALWLQRQPGAEHADLSAQLARVPVCCFWEDSESPDDATPPSADTSANVLALLRALTNDRAEPQATAADRPDRPPQPSPPVAEKAQR